MGNVPGNGCRVARFHEKACLPVKDRLTRGAGCQRNDRQAKALCLQVGDAKALVGWYGQQVVAAIGAGQRCIVEPPEEADARQNPVGARPRGNLLRIGV